MSAFLISTKPATSEADVEASTFRVKPKQTLPLYTSGPVGMHVQITLERVPNSGGHYHGGNTNNPLAVGVISPNDFTISGNYPQNIVSTYSAPDVCGSNTITWHFSNGHVQSHIIEVMFDSFLPIPQTTGIKLKPPTPIHPNSYWADPSFIVKLKSLGEKYRAATGKDLTITDASLPWGGRLDIDPHHEWDKPHAEHWNGNQADIRLSDMTESDQAAFKAACTASGITFQIDNGNHWHVRG